MRHMRSGPWRTTWFLSWRNLDSRAFQLLGMIAAVVLPIGLRSITRIEWNVLLSLTFFRPQTPRSEPTRGWPGLSGRGRCLRSPSRSPNGSCQPLPMPLSMTRLAVGALPQMHLAPKCGRMRGALTDQGQLFSYISPEARVRTDHPLRKIRKLVRDVLGELSLSLSRLYASEGRPSIPPEQLLSALLLQVFYGIRSERQLMEQLDYNLLYRWFVGLSPDDLVWDPTVFTKNRDRLQSGEVFAKFMTKLLNHPQVKPLLSDEHFSVDGTLIEAW